MKKNHVLFVLTSLIFGSLAFVSCSKKETLTKEVNIYTYDSFSGEWGAGPAIAQAFEAKTGIHVNYIDCEDGVAILSRAVSEKAAPQADILLGLDNNLALRAAKEDVLVSYKAANLEKCVSSDFVKALNPKTANLLTPYDYSHFAVIFDTLSSYKAPACLSDLTKPEYEAAFITMDPRTSTPGLGFVSWTVAVFGDDYPKFWEALKPSILTMSPSWSSGYGMFTNGESPMAISYVTSPAYHVEYDDTDRFQAVLFDEGHVMQVEGAGLLKGAKNAAAAKMFLDFLVSTEAQELLPIGQWMFPVNKDVVLPSCYDICKVPSKTIYADAEKVEKAVNVVMDILNR